MSGINTGKVITGGIAAGVALNITDAVWSLVLGTDYTANATRLGLDPALMQSPLVMGTWVVVDLLVGILLVFTYAAIRPRFGPGPRTAVIAALVPYLAVSLVLLGFAHMAYLDMHLYFKASGLQLIGWLVGANVGAYLYKEG